jgi:AcrR family transcriptional regulator
VDDASLKQHFDSDPSAVFLDVLRVAGERLTAKRVKDGLIERGLPEPSVSKQWAAFQRDVLKYHPHISRPTTQSYEWREEPVAAEDALTRLLDLLSTTSKSKSGLRDQLADLIRAGLKTADSHGQDSPGPESSDSDGDESRFRATQQRQARIDVVRAVAELAGEVEEIAYNSGDPDVIVERLQTRVKARSVDQIGRSGDAASFDPALHDAIGARPAVGAAVSVVRPGYSWRDGAETFVLQKALVAAG